MADGAERTPTVRVPMTLPGAPYVIEVPEGDVEQRLEQGWKRVRASRRADTGSVPTQPTQPTSGSNR